MKRAARAALKWKKEASRRAAERASGKDTNRTPPSRFEDVVLLLLQDSRKKALDKIKRRGDGAAKRRAKDDGAATGSGQRVGVSSLIHGALHASIDTDERRRLSADGGRSAPECGGSDRKNKKRARGRSQSSFRWVSVCMFCIRCFSLLCAFDLQRRRWLALLGGRRPERSMTEGKRHTQTLPEFTPCTEVGSAHSGSNCRTIFLELFVVADILPSFLHCALVRAAKPAVTHLMFLSRTL